MSYLRLVLEHLHFLFQKELIAMMKDPRMKFLLIAPPIIQGLIFGYAASYNLDSVPYAVVDESHSAASTDFLAHVDGSPNFVRVATLDNPEQMGDYIDAGQILLAVVIPQDFATRLAAGEQAPVQLIADGRNSQVAGLTTSYMSQIITAWNEEARGGRGGIAVEARTWYNPNQLTRWNFLPGLIVMISFVQVVLLAGMSIAKEREEGTFDQLLVTPLTPAEILVGKAWPPMLVGIFQSTVLLLLSVFWFRITFQGSLFALYLILLVFALSATGVGLSISAISKSMQQVLVYVLVFLIPMVLLSGIATPVDNMPAVLQYLTYIDPMRFAVDAVRRIYLEGAALQTIAHDFIPLIAIACVTLPTAGWLFRHKTV
ncbi:MAG: ABC transporter permease [Selenomonadaceae bacterium]|nr:ABC transporter permease [Selenomonadaceae bacterium]